MSSISLETINELVAGSAGGAAQVIVGHPLDTIKTRAQIAPSEVSFSTVSLRISENVFDSWLRIYLS